MTAGLSLDLHVHSNRSPDGRAEVDLLVALAKEAGLNGLALTDHNTVAGHSRLAEIGRDHPELRLIPGVEVSTIDGHLLVYGTAVVPPTGRPVVETVEWVEAQGGVAVPAHPLRRVHGIGRELAGSCRVPALEVVNGHNGRSANAGARTIAAVRSLGATGGSDAHAAREVGWAWTRFPAGSESRDDLLDALRRGQTSGEGRSAGPLRRSGIALRSLGLRLRRGLRPI